MKQLFVITLIAVIYACKVQKNPCDHSTGKTWSQLKKECIHISSQGLPLSPINSNKYSTATDAFILFNNDSPQKAELFLPNHKRSTILKQQNDSIFVHKSYSYNTHSGVLLKNSIPIFLYKKEDSTTLIILYDAEIGKSALMDAIQLYKANMIYEYKILKGVVIQVKKSKAKDAILFFQQIPGVLTVQEDQKLTIQSPS